MTAKRILIVDTGKEWGGGINSLLELLKRVDRSRYGFTALFYDNFRKGGDSDIRTELERLGVAFIHLPRAPQPVWAKLLKEVLRGLLFFSRAARRRAVFWVDCRARIRPLARRISRVIAEGGFDLLYLNNQPSSNLEAILAGEAAGVPVVQHVRSEAEHNGFEVAATNRVLAKIITVSEDLRDAMTHQGMAREMMVVVHNGIDPRVRPERSKQEIRAALGIDAQALVIGTVGSLLRRKRTDDFIRALAHVRNVAAVPLWGMVVGEGPERDRLERLGEELGLRQQLFFAGFQSDPLSYIQAMDVFVLPSEKEGLPRVILEAMLMEKPVVATRVAGSREVVAEGQTGLLVPLGDVTIMAEAIGTLLRDPELRERLGRAGKQRAIDHFSIERYVSGVEAVFDEILANAGGETS